MRSMYAVSLKNQKTCTKRQAVFRIMAVAFLLAVEKQKHKASTSKTTLAAQLHSQYRISRHYINASIEICLFI